MPHPWGRTQGSKDALILSIAWEGGGGGFALIGARM